MYLKKRWKKKENKDNCIIFVVSTTTNKHKTEIMMIREFKILATNQIWSGYYLTDGSGDIQCLTNEGHEIFFEWEFELVTAGDTEGWK